MGRNFSLFLVHGIFLMGTIANTFKLSGTIPICKELLNAIKAPTNIQRTLLRITC